MISVVAQSYNIHPQTLRRYEREGLLKPSRTDGNTRLVLRMKICEQLETILSLTRDLGVNLAGVEIILNMRRKIGADAGRGQRVHGMRRSASWRAASAIGSSAFSIASSVSSPTDLCATEQAAPTIMEAPTKT